MKTGAKNLIDLLSINKCIRPGNRGPVRFRFARAWSIGRKK